MPEERWIIQMRQKSKGINNVTVHSGSLVSNIVNMVLSLTAAVAVCCFHKHMSRMQLLPTYFRYVTKETLSIKSSWLILFGSNYTLRGQGRGGQQPMILGAQRSLHFQEWRKFLQRSSGKSRIVSWCDNITYNISIDLQAILVPSRRPCRSTIVCELFFPLFSTLICAQNICHRYSEYVASPDWYTCTKPC